MTESGHEESGYFRQWGIRFLREECIPFGCTVPDPCPIHVHDRHIKERFEQFILFLPAL